MENKINKDFREDIERVEVDQIPTSLIPNPASNAATLYDVFAETAKEKAANHNYNYLYKKELDQFISLLPPKGVVVDLGCGFGSEVAYFDSLGFNAIGIDISSKSIEVAKKRYPHFNFIVGDFSNPNNYGGLKIDGFHEHLSLMNLPKEEIKKVLTLFYNALANGGLLQMSFEEDNSEMTGWYSVPTSNTFDWEGKRAREVRFLYLSYYSVDALKETIQGAGFNIISINSHNEEDLQRNIITALCKKI